MDVIVVGLLSVIGALILSMLTRWIRAGHQDLEWKQSTLKSGFLYRRLCRNERAYLNWGHRYFGANKVGVLLALKGAAVDLNQLTNAVKKLERRHPLLRATLCENSTFEAEAVSSTSSPLVSLVTQQNRSGDAGKWREIWDTRQLHPLIKGNGMFEFVLISDTNSNNTASETEHFCEILLLGQHVVCDGDSASILTCELLETLVDPDIAWKPRPFQPSQTAIIINEVPSFFKDQLRIWISFFVLWLPFVSLFTWGVKESPVTKTKPRRINYRCSSTQYDVDLDLEKTEKLVAAAKLRGVTVNAALMAAVSRSVYETHGFCDLKTRYVGLSCTANLRKRYKTAFISSKDIGMHATGVYSFSSFKNMNSEPDYLWSIAKQMGEKVSKNASHDVICTTTLSNGLLYPLLPTNIHMKIRNLHFGNTVAVIGNWGRTPYKEIYQGREGRTIRLLDMKPLVNFNVQNCVYCGFTTTHGKLKVSMMASPRLHTNDQMQELAEKVVRFLNKMSTT